LWGDYLDAVVLAVLGLAGDDHELDDDDNDADRRKDAHDDHHGLPVLDLRDQSIGVAGRARIHCASGRRDRQNAARTARDGHTGGASVGRCVARREHNQDRTSSGAPIPVGGD
jgi:hypothetical protein